MPAVPQAPTESELLAMLKARGGPAIAIARVEGDHGGQVAARAVAHHRQAARVAADLRRVFGAPPQHRPGVVHRRRERMLGRESVIGHHHDRIGLGRYPRAHRVELASGADREPPTVVEHDDRSGRVVAGGPMHPTGHPGDLVVTRDDPVGHRSGEEHERTERRPLLGEGRIGEFHRQIGRAHV